MFKLNELSGTLIKSGRFLDAIPVFYDELDDAVCAGVITYSEFFKLSKAFAWILLNPSNFADVQQLGDQMISLALRMPGKVPTISQEEFEANVRASREAK